MAGLRLIVGFGNPGPEHAEDRHNAGFRLIDALAESHRAVLRPEGKLHGNACQIEIDGQAVRLLKPSTYMNRSGLAVGTALRYFRIEPAEMLVAHDELDLAAGIARLKFDGGHGGQNGLRDTMEVLGHGRFHRLRVGIGHPGHKDRVTPWVLGRASQADDRCIAQAIDDALSVIPLAVAGRFSDAMKALHTPKGE